MRNEENFEVTQKSRKENFKQHQLSTFNKRICSYSRNDCSVVFVHTDLFRKLSVIKIRGK